MKEVGAPAFTDSITTVSSGQHKQRSILLLVVVVTVLAACEEVPVEPSADRRPLISDLTLAENADNGLSVTATVHAQNAAAVALEYWTHPDSVELTPLMPAQNGGVQVALLGLRAQRSYFIRGVAFSPNGSMARSPLRSYQPRKLPDDLPRYSISMRRNPSRGYVMLGVTRSTAGPSYALIIDNDGNPVWYRKFDGAVVDFQRQSPNRYTVCSSVNGSPQQFVEVTGSGRITRTYAAATTPETGPHELRLVGNGYVLFGVEYRMLDLTSFGGPASARVKGITVEYIRPPTAPLVWNTFDHFSVTDGASDISLNDQTVNPWHGNAIDVDTDGHLLVSFRNMDTIAKIHAETGEVLWRLGGKKNQFTFVGDPLNGFSHQHGIRRLPNGHIILFDNGNLHTPPSSRAVEYSLDENTKVATLVWEYRPNPPLFGFALGFAQRLPNGNTLICFGTAQKVIEVDQQGTKQWELTMEESDRFVYRAFRIDSLY
jgi:hypothetical protein